MTRRYDWMVPHLSYLLDHGHFQVETLAHRLQSRGPEAVATVCQGIHTCHQGLDEAMLPRLMRRRLVECRGTVICPVCGDRI